MGSKYTLALTSTTEGATLIYKTITVGEKEVHFRFQWSVASEEQFSIIEQYINTKMKSDPFLIEGSYVYEYDYIGYYDALFGKSDVQLGEWLDTDPLLPNSIRAMERSAQINTLKDRATEAHALKGAVDHYKEELKWHFQADYRDETTVGVIEPGGWYRSQDPVLQFRFVSPLAYIGKNDFNNVTIEFEVDNA